MTLPIKTKKGARTFPLTPNEKKFKRIREIQRMREKEKKNVEQAEKLIVKKKQRIEKLELMEEVKKLFSMNKKLATRRH